MGHAARRRARTQERAHGVGGRAECLSEAWLQGGEGGGDGLEALWGGGDGVKALDGEGARFARLTHAERGRESIVHQGCHHLLLNWFFCLIRCVELRLDARNTVTGYYRFHCGRMARGFLRIDEAQPPLNIVCAERKVFGTMVDR